MGDDTRTEADQGGGRNAPAQRRAYEVWEARRVYELPVDEGVAWTVREAEPNDDVDAPAFFDVLVRVLGDDGTQFTADATKPDDACWQAIDAITRLRDQAVAAGRGEVRPPQLVAIAFGRAGGSALAPSGYSLKPRGGFDRVTS